MKIKTNVKAGDRSSGGESKATFHDLSFVHNIDRASPVLM
jgi:type VI protein secretion system component Hcp